MNSDLADIQRRSMTQKTPCNRRFMTHRQSVGRVLLCAAALGLVAGVGHVQSTTLVTTSPRDSLRPSWNGVCSLAVGGSDVQWAVGDSGKVLKMVNGDSSVGYVIGRGQFDLCSISFADADHGWIVGFKREEPNRGSGVVFSTKRGGSKATDWVWSCPAVRPDVNVPFVKVQALSNRHVWVTCGDRYMLYTNDGGARWAVTARRLGAGESGTAGSDHEK